MDTQDIRSKRKRSQNACGPCRQRKRRCDGRSPCITCCEWGYDCFYDNQKRGTSRYTVSETNNSASLPSSSPGSQESTQEADKVSSKKKIIDRVEANSGAAFIRNMGDNIDPTSTTKLNLFGWNTGHRQLPSSVDSVAPFSLFEITSFEAIKCLAGVYFDKVNPCYGLLDPKRFFRRLELRSNLPLACDPYDSTFAGVAALGSLFSQHDVTLTETQLVQYARSMLEGNDACSPSVEILTGWILHLLYMRMTSKPYPTWLASSNMMHMLEASGIHRWSSTECEARALESEIAPRERLVGVAQHLNLWVSFDLGLSRVSFADEWSVSLSEQFQGKSNGILNLLPISASLDPGNANDGEKLKSSFLSILQKVYKEGPEILAQCNLVLCMFRRLHLWHSNFDQLVIDRTLTLLQSGLEAARALSNSCCPWHHIANVPFHTLYALLVLDTSASFQLVPEAMETLWQVASTYNTATMREAVYAAERLVLLYQQRRTSDVIILSEALNSNQPRGLDVDRIQIQDSWPNNEQVSWLMDLVGAMPTLEGVTTAEDLFG
ncbi:hypothetical protein AnigIFM50267_002870 [Aspergillus niger]|nr:hypothetical protein AnigIFM50267_002870 [Aspergillus niger]